MVKNGNFVMERNGGSGFTAKRRRRCKQARQNSSHWINSSLSSQDIFLLSWHLTPHRRVALH
ncbi:hypothetical protein A2U01_0071262 [Trifolium medium]|uniref:Uncharacterized protein n=1 Tax=Trifolium medium TaxID=97028 RepID=A0A392SM94_9FABA|nr:hypothetical protein [Trifolium medium]